MALNYTTSYERPKSYKETPSEYTARRQAQSERKYESRTEHASRLAWVREKSNSNNCQKVYSGGGTRNNIYPTDDEIKKAKELKEKHEKMEKRIMKYEKDRLKNIHPDFVYNHNVGRYVNMSPNITRYYVENESDHSKYSGDIYQGYYYKDNNKK